MLLVHFRVCSRCVAVLLCPGELYSFKVDVYSFGMMLAETVMRAVVPAGEAAMEDPTRILPKDCVDAAGTFPSLESCVLLWMARAYQYGDARCVCHEVLVTGLVGCVLWWGWLCDGGLQGLACEVCGRRWWLCWRAANVYMTD